MSETLYNGPIDIVRRVNHEAAELDSIANDYIDASELPENVSDEVAEHYKKMCSERYDEIWDAVMELDKGHSLIGHEVTIYGDELTVSLGETGPKPYARPVERLYPAPTGTYRGHHLKRMYDPDTDSYIYRVVHILEEQPQIFWDDFGAHHHITPHAYIAATGSELVPTQPINAHSLEDLRQDRVIEEFDSIVFDESRTRIGILKDVGSFANKFLAKTRADDNRTNQRMSYFNSVGLLSGIILVTNDALLTEVKNGDPVIAGITHLDQTLSVQPNYLYAALAYERSKNGLGAVFLGSQQMYAQGQLPDGRMVAAPLKNILDIS